MRNILKYTLVVLMTTTYGRQTPSPQTRSPAVSDFTTATPDKQETDVLALSRVVPRLRRHCRPRFLLRPYRPRPKAAMDLLTAPAVPPAWLARLLRDRPKSPVIPSGLPGLTSVKSLAPFPMAAAPKVVLMPMVPRSCRQRGPAHFTAVDCGNAAASSGAFTGRRRILGAQERPRSGDARRGLHRAGAAAARAGRPLGACRQCEVRGSPHTRPSLESLFTAECELHRNA